jgi:hypothetical protein
MRISSFLKTIAFTLSCLPLTSSAEEEAPPPQIVPEARDGLGGRLHVNVSGGFAAPFGHIAQSVKATARSGNGWMLGGDLGYGVNRQVVIGAYAEYLGLGASTPCRSCSASSLGAGAFAQYHFVQGLRFDPYVSYGLGLRTLSSEDQQESYDYLGLEWFRFGMGANWYILPQLAAGPFLQFGGGTMLKLPADENIKGSYWRFITGIKIHFQMPGR